MRLEDREMERKSDEKLALMAQRGDIKAEEYLIEKYKDLVKIKSRVYFIAGGDMDDVIQEGMIGIFKAIRSYDEGKEASFRTHAENCIKGQILNAVKGANRLKNQPLNQSVPIEDKEDIVWNGQNPEERLLLKELIDFLMEGKEKTFTKAESQVLDLMIKGHGIKEIAERLDKSYKAVDNTMQRIKKKIAKKYDDVLL